MRNILGIGADQHGQSLRQYKKLAILYSILALIIIYEERRQCVSKTAVFFQQGFPSRNLPAQDTLKGWASDAVYVCSYAYVCTIYCSVEQTQYIIIAVIYQHFITSIQK